MAERVELSERLLGGPVVEAHDVPHQRPYRWQARTTNLVGLDLTLDEGQVDWWAGLANDVDFLVDRVGATAERNAWMRSGPTTTYDVAGADDETWAVLSWIAGSLLHGRTTLARLALGDLIDQRIAPVTGTPAYAINETLQRRFEPAMPSSFHAAEIARALKATQILYDKLLAEWATTHHTITPRSAFRPTVIDVLDRLIAGNGTHLTGPPQLD